ncbi:MAG: recombination-associated protein RdgC [Azoarcus sp.]|jgi:recombination associated protein RdgC|nr:recombination-associated protein RdgC [Azoarcus sp.]
MMFRNLHVFRLNEPLTMTADTFESGLRKHALQPCGTREKQTFGWVPPDNTRALLRVVAGQWLLASGSEERTLSALAVRQEVEKRAAELSKKQCFPCGRNQRDEIHEMVHDEFIARAPTVRRRTRVWIDPENGLLGVDTASGAAVGYVEWLLSKTLGYSWVTPLRTVRLPTVAMATWLEDEPPANFTIDQDCELRSVGEEKMTVRYAHHPLDGGEIREHLRAGKMPTKLALTFNDRVSFVLTDKLEIRRLDFLDPTRWGMSYDGDAEAQFDAEFAVMTGGLRSLIPALVEALGGVRK